MDKVNPTEHPMLGLIVGLLAPDARQLCLAHQAQRLLAFGQCPVAQETLIRQQQANKIIEQHVSKSKQ